MRWVALALITANFAFCQVTIPWTQVNKTGSSLADLATRSATDLTGTLPVERLPAFTGGDATTSAGSGAITFGTVNSNVGVFGSATQAAVVTVNAKGLVTAASNVTIVPTTVTVVDSSDSTSYVLVVDSATGNLQAKTDPGITYNSASGALVLTGPITAGSGTEFKNTWIKSGNSSGIKLGADDSSTNLTDATTKGANVSIPHYSSSTEEDVTVFRLTSSSGSNTFNIGGSNSTQNSVTSVNFYTAATNTTTSGTRRGGFNSAGVFDVTATTSSVNTTSGSVVIGGGLGVAENINAGGYVKSSAAVTGLTINSTNGGVYSSATGTGNDGGAGSVTYGGIAPITFYVKDVPVLTSGVPADIATIILPAGITRWTTTLGSSTNSGGVRCSAWDFTATMAGANFTLYAGAGGTGTALTGVFTGPGSDTVYTSAAAASGSTIVESNTIYIRQTANSTNPGSCDFYITIYPLP